MRARALAAAALAGVFALAGAPAYAADGGVTVSLDGTTFTSSVTSPLFDPALRVVPGDVVTEDLWVRNSSTTDARVRLDVLDARADDPLFAAALTLGARTTDATGRELPTRVVDAGACTVVLRDVVLAAGATVRLAVTATVGDLVRQDGMDATASFRLRAVAVDEVASTPSDPRACSEGATVPTQEPTDDATAPTPSDPRACSEGGAEPTEGPTDGPTGGPTDGPTEGPTGGPTEGPTDAPTSSPDPERTDTPTENPTAAPTTTPDDGDLPTTGASPTVALGFAAALVVSGLLVLALRRRKDEEEDVA